MMAGNVILADGGGFVVYLIAVLLLAGYVFGIIWVIPGLALVLAAALGFGARANLFGRLFQALFADRLKPSTASAENGAVARFSELFAVAVLSVATLLVVIGLGGLAWVVALVEAGICALHASTGVSVEAAVHDRIFGRRGR